MTSQEPSTGGIAISVTIFVGTLWVLLFWFTS